MDCPVDKFVSRADPGVCSLLKTLYDPFFWALREHLLNWPGLHIKLFGEDSYQTIWLRLLITVAVKSFDRCESLTISLSIYALIKCFVEFLLMAVYWGIWRRLQSVMKGCSRDGRSLMLKYSLMFKAWRVWGWRCLKNVMKVLCKRLAFRSKSAVFDFSCDQSVLITVSRRSLDLEFFDECY